MFRLLLIAALITAGSSASAQGWDQSVSVLGRTHAAALAVAPTLGYGKILWGERSGFQYGYLRPHLTLIGTPASYGSRAAIDIFPISIFGISAARNWLHRFKSPSGFGCDKRECQGPLHANELKAKLLLGYGDFFISAQRTWMSYDERDSERPLLELGNVVYLRNDGERSQQWTLIAGMRMGSMAFGLMHMDVDLSEDRNAQESQYAFLRKDLADFGYPTLSATLAAGRFDSALEEDRFSALGILTYTGAAALGFGN